MIGIREDRIDFKKNDDWYDVHYCQALNQILDRAQYEAFGRSAKRHGLTADERIFMVNCFDPAQRMTKPQNVIDAWAEAIVLDIFPGCTPERFGWWVTAIHIRAQAIASQMRPVRN